MKLVVERRWHSLGREAVRGQGKQEPGFYFAVVHTKTGKVFSWSYVHEDMANLAIANLLDMWEADPAKEQSDLEWNFRTSFDTTLISARRP